MFEHPINRYISPEMEELFSKEKKASLWRELWAALAEGEKRAGLNITEEQIKEMWDNVYKIDLERIEELEKETKHDVMAHIKAFGEDAPSAAGIIHLGATSCYVTDNTDLWIYKSALGIILEKLVGLMNQLYQFCMEHLYIPTLGYTHFQPAQPTTVGKRGSLWLYDFYVTTQEIERVKNTLKFLGIRGATGTQASFMTLFNEDEHKIKECENYIKGFCGFKETYPTTGQTYPRIEDVRILNSLSLIASSANKMAEDARLLAHEGELLESFSEGQIGSSAMPHKRNPIQCEKVCSLSRYLKNLIQNGIDTHQHQWLERTLDDSAGRRLYMPEAFIVSEAIIRYCTEIIQNISVNKEKIKDNLDKNIVYLSMEEFLMKATTNGGDRQALHEKLKKYIMEVKDQDSLKEKLKNDPVFNEFIDILNRKDVMVGLATSQVWGLVKEVLNYIDSRKEN